jgi:hypothetical protein
MRTPWGYSDYEEECGNGIKFYGTPSHGGYKIPKKLNNLIPNYMRIENGWYEEDCDWSIPIIVIGKYFNQEEFVKSYANALDTFKNWHWQSYEKFFDIELQEGESYLKDQYLFIEKHKNDLIVVSATSSDEIPSMVDCHVVKGGRDHSGNYASNERYRYLVETDEYRERSRFGFVIDPDKHQLIKKGW